MGRQKGTRIKARITKLWCTECGAFLGLVRYDVEFPIASQPCCKKTVAKAIVDATPRSPRVGVGRRRSENIDEGHYSGYGGWDNIVRTVEDNR